MNWFRDIYIIYIPKPKYIWIYFVAFCAFWIRACAIISINLKWILILQSALFPHFTQVSGLSPALTATRSLGHQDTGKHTLLLTSKTPSRKNTSFPEKPTKPKRPRVTYLYLISPCRSPSLSQTLVRVYIWRIHTNMCGWCWICALSHICNVVCGTKRDASHLPLMFLYVCCVFLHKMFTCCVFILHLIGLIPSQNPRLAFQQYLEVVGNDRPYKCQYCSKAYKKSSHLKQHVR